MIKLVLLLALIIFAVIAMISVLFGFFSSSRKLQELADRASVAGGCLFRLATYGLILATSFVLFLKISMSDF